MTTQRFARELNPSYKFLPVAAVLVAFATSPAFAQSNLAQNAPGPGTARRPLGELPGARDIAGTWQGTVQAVPALRIVLNISKTDSDSLKAVMYSIDLGTQSIPITTITLHDATLK